MKPVNTAMSVIIVMQLVCSACESDRAATAVAPLDESRPASAPELMDPEEVRAADAELKARLRTAMTAEGLDQDTTQRVEAELQRQLASVPQSTYANLECSRMLCTVDLLHPGVRWMVVSLRLQSVDDGGLWQGERWVRQLSGETHLAFALDGGTLPNVTTEE